MLSDCKWLLSEFATRLERFALLEAEVASEYQRGAGFSAILTEGLVSPYLQVVDDSMLFLGNKTLVRLRTELRSQGLLREGEELRAKLESLLANVGMLDTLKGKHSSQAFCEVQEEALLALNCLLGIWAKLPKDEPVTAGQLAKSLQRDAKPAHAKQVARALERPDAPPPLYEADNPKRAGTKIKYWSRDSAMHYFSQLPGWEQ